jgi:uridine kinase
MKSALIISGYLRTIKNNLNSIKEMIIDRFDVCDIYLHITCDEKKEDKYINQIDDRAINYVIDFLKPVVVLREANKSYSSDRAENTLYNLWMKFYKLNKLKEINESDMDKYDVVIKYRPDFRILSTIPFEFVKKFPDTIFIPKDDKIDSSKLQSINDAHVCDAFAFGSSKAMNKYFPSYDKIEHEIIKNNTVPETFLANHLSSLDYKKLEIEYVIILSSCNIFAIAGDSGSGKSTLANILKNNFSDSFLLECDRYHKWERGNEMWAKITHLNPQGNFLSKMNEDIFDLKIGNTIYQVDYDHKNGKFTEKEAITSSDNIIVCGLHSLYMDDDRLYNITIFLDTDRTLKYKWKIRRDTKKRGYLPEKILEQINARENDYKKYIEPQRDRSDIIINFFTDKPFNINEVYEDETVYLRVLVSKKYLLLNVIREFNLLGIIHSLTENSNYYIINFTSFSAKKYDSSEISEFYRYILIVILNIVAAA